MAKDAPVPTIPTYCTHVHVAEVLQVPEPTEANDEGEPTRAAWNRAIMATEEEIDRATRHAWRERKVTEERLSADTVPDYYGFIPIKLRHRAIRIPLATGSGDKLEVREGSTYVDYVANKTQTIAGDFFVQDDHGFLHLKRRFLPVTKDFGKITYRYGENEVPASIREATALMAAARLALGDKIGVAGSGGELDRVGLTSKIEEWKTRAAKILVNFVEVT